MTPASGQPAPELIARLEKRQAQHKYDHGHAVILSGGSGHGGAARLAARAALRVGAGLVTLGCPPDALAENAAQLTAVMVRPVDGADDLAAWLRDTRLNAIGLGPGMGLGRRTRAMVSAALEKRRATLLDADALTVFAEAPASLFGMLHENVVLTPHMGEFARLFPAIAAEMRANGLSEDARMDLVKAAAAEAGCTILLKGARTRIANSKGRVCVNEATGPRAAPWLATAGSGDVLAGVLTGLMARGYSTQDAAQLGSFLHVEAARQVGPGLIAEDLPEALPGVFRALGL